MMAEQRQEAVERQVGFQTVRLLKSETLGIGSYGSVCKARCDNLVCAAKILHPTLFDPTAHQKIARKREHRLPIKRFEQECEFMSAIRHPNIVQYLGMHQDPETGLPVLLMELMDDSLTHFLESSQNTVPYHIQVNFCHDITLALSFLHSNGITHRDLSSNNVLLCGNVKAKVTDFGMAKLSDTTPERTRSFTMCPGTDSFMPPEAAKNVPEYTEKIDCFSFGVLVIQILTKKFPDPSDRLKEICTVDPQFPSGTVEVRVAEVERRQAHIKDIDANDPLLLIALDCLRDRETQRPSSQDLCDRITALKETAKYVESVRSVAERVDRLREELEQQHVSEINDLKDEHAEQLEQKDKTISTQQEDIEQLTIENQQLKEQLQEKDKEIACIQREHLQALQIKTQAVNAQKRKKQEFFELVKQYKEQKEHHAMEISELHTEKDQQISERDKTNVARQEENQHLREEIQKLRQEHDRQIKERDETIAARQQEICLLNQRHFKQLQHYKSMLSKHWILTLLSQYPIGRCIDIITWHCMHLDNVHVCTFLSECFLLIHALLALVSIDDVPDYKAQKTELHPLLQQRLRKGDTWLAPNLDMNISYNAVYAYNMVCLCTYTYRYLVDVRWMKQWKKYVGYDQWDQSSAGQESANPGPVDNSTLFKGLHSVL